LFYEGVGKVLEAIDDAEAAVMASTLNLRGSIFVAAPLGVGRRFIAPHVPAFKDEYPQIDVRLRLSDRTIDVMGEGLDMAFHMGALDDSSLKMRLVADCPRLLCAAPSYVARRGDPVDGDAILRDGHDCLNLRFPGAREFQWTLSTPQGPKRFEVAGPFETDDGDVLTAWALDGRGIILKPIFEVAEHLKSGALVPVAAATPPLPVQLTCLTQHRRLRDPKIRVFTDFIIAQCRADLTRVSAGIGAGGEVTDGALCD
jgi:DNA-binding transcriptional LysR family regulator